MRKIRLTTLAVITLVSFVRIASRAEAAPLSDIPSDHWAKQAFEALVSKGFISGFPHDVFGGQRAATRYQTAVILARALLFLEKNKPYIPKMELDQLKETLADYQDEIDALGLQLETLENRVAALQTRVERIERLQTSGELHNRTVATQITGNLGTGNGKDTTFAEDRLIRPYPLFPVHAGENSTMLGWMELTAKLADNWQGGGRIAAYSSTGDALNGLVWGGTPPFLNNPFEGYLSTNNLKTELDQFFAKTEDHVLTGEIGAFSPQHSPRYLYSGVPNLTEEDPDFLPSHGGRLEVDMKPYLFISKAFSEIFAGKLAQASPWQTQMFGANFGIELLGVTLGAHWMTAQNDPANFAAGTAGMITVPINGGGGWLDPTLLTPIAVGPQKEKIWGVDLSVARTYADHPLTFRIAFATSDYKPNTNSSNNAGGQLYNLALEAGASKNISAGVEYLSVDPKYSPFILPFSLPTGITTSNFPWGQWPFPVDFQGYYTLQNSQEYPQNRQGVKTFFTWNIPNGKVAGNYRWLVQKVQSQLTNFSNDVDIQSIGFFEPLFTVSGARPNLLPIGTTNDWGVSLHYDIRVPLALELGTSGVNAKRYSGDANNVNFSGWLGHVGLIYSFLEKWKLDAAYHVAHTDGRLLAAPGSPGNYLLRNTGRIVRVDYDVDSKTDAFVLFRNLDHLESQGTSNFHLLQVLTGVDVSF